MNVLGWRVVDDALEIAVDGVPLSAAIGLPPGREVVTVGDRWELGAAIDVLESLAGRGGQVLPDGVAVVGSCSRCGDPEIVARVRADGGTLTWSGFGWYDDRAGADPISSDPGDLGGGFGVSFTFDRSTTEATLAATAARLRALARPFAYRGAELPARPRLLQRLGLARPRTYLGVDLADW